MLGRGDLGLPLKNDISDFVVLMSSDPVQPHRPGIQGRRYDLFLPESLSVHEVALAVPPTTHGRFFAATSPGLSAGTGSLR